MAAAVVGPVEGAALLDGLCGVAYLVDRESRLAAIGGRNWDSFAVQNGCPELTAASVVGRDVLSFIAGEEVRAAVRRYERALRRREVPQVEFAFRCDGPAVVREMRMMMTPVGSGDEPAHILYHAILLHASDRPAINLLEPEVLYASLEATRGLPIATICAYCAHVRIGDPDRDDAAPAVWTTAEEYYRRGGTSEVRISHGICPECRERVLRENDLPSP